MPRATRVEIRKSAPTLLIGDPGTGSDEKEWDR
jgi:hypothetical protein